MFIKKVTISLLETHLTALKASKEKLKTMAKEETKLTDEELKFYYTQMQQIYTGLTETQKQIEMFNKGEKNANKDCSKI